MLCLRVVSLHVYFTINSNKCAIKTSITLTQYHGIGDRTHRPGLSSQHLHYLVHCRTFRRNGFPTALDEIPCVICHSWIFQSMWAFPFREKSYDLKVASSTKRNSIKERLLFKSHSI